MTKRQVAIPASVISVDNVIHTCQGTDSLQGVASLVYAGAEEPLAALANLIADRPILRSGKVLNLVRLTYPGTEPASLNALADYFQVSTVELLRANGDVQLQSGQQVTESYVTQAGEAVAPLLDRLGNALDQL